MILMISYKSPIYFLSLRTETGHDSRKKDEYSNLCHEQEVFRRGIKSLVMLKCKIWITQGVLSSFLLLEGFYLCMSLFH